MTVPVDVGQGDVARPWPHLHARTWHQQRRRRRARVRGQTRDDRDRDEAEACDSKHPGPRVTSAGRSTSRADQYNLRAALAWSFEHDHAVLRVEARAA
jgi:hypothetical protein